MTSEMKEARRLAVLKKICEAAEYDLARDISPEEVWETTGFDPGAVNADLLYLHQKGYIQANSAPTDAGWEVYNLILTVEGIDLIERIEKGGPDQQTDDFSTAGISGYRSLLVQNFHAAVKNVAGRDVAAPDFGSFTVAVEQMIQRDPGIPADQKPRIMADIRELAALHNK